jgi:hypothetical protein
MWHYLTKEDMIIFKQIITDKKLYYKLQSQALHRRPMLKESYDKLINKYGKQ